MNSDAISGAHDAIQTGAPCAQCGARRAAHVVTPDAGRERPWAACVVCARAHASFPELRRTMRLQRALQDTAWQLTLARRQKGHALARSQHA